MRNRDLEKLRVFEEWLLDDDIQEEKKTIERNGVISVIVRSSQYWRVFTTESYSIRSLVVHLNRYCPEYQIVAFRYGLFPTRLLSNTEWRKLTKAAVDELRPFFQDFSNIGTKEQIMALDAPYRDKINLHYLSCAASRVYPSKRPMRGVAIAYMPYEASIYGTTVEHPFFVADDETIYAEPSDILNHYDGKRLERTVCGKTVKGYLIDRCRLEYNKKN